MWAKMPLAYQIVGFLNSEVPSFNNDEIAWFFYILIVDLKMFGRV